MAKRTPKKLTHIPALKPERLTLATQAISQLPINEAAKTALTNMITAAANPNAEHPIVVLKSLEQDRQDNAHALMKAVGGAIDGVRARGKRALLDMPAAEWEALVNGSDTG